MDVQAARTELKSFIDAEKTAFLARPGFGPLEETICRKVDDVVTQLWNRNGGFDVPGFALIAIGGNGATATEFQKVILPGFLGRNRDAFLRGLIEAKKQRYARFGDTIFQLEPDIKDAPGGVRDFHWADWIRKALDAPPEPRSTEILSFHHFMRNYLHFRAGRNLNTLSYEFQEQIAPWLGYTESPHGEAEETMM